MSDFNSLDHLGPIADEMLSGLHADDAMRLKIKQAAVNGSHRAGEQLLPLIMQGAAAHGGGQSAARGHCTDDPDAVQADGDAAAFCQYGLRCAAGVAAGCAGTM